jgi:CobQ/CobB/MinD/ParA family nucleotide binding protein
VIYTFYSFKGGVGRSMAMANIGTLLYQAGFRVLLVDWDLEAPGLERYFGAQIRKAKPDAPTEPSPSEQPSSREFRPALEHALQRPPDTNLDPLIQRVHDNPGLIDLVTEYKRRMSKRVSSAKEDGANAIFDRLFPSGLRPYIVDLVDTSRDSSCIALLPAGRRTDYAQYGQKVSNFSWEDFFANWGGAQFFEWMRQQLNGLADVVLIDSRTGVTEMGGVCVYNLADTVVILCAPNDQNLEGTFKVASDLALSDPAALRPYRGDRKLQVLVIPSRVEDRAEAGLIASFAADFNREAKNLIPKALRATCDSTWALRIPYVPYYAFRERLAVREEGEGAASGSTGGSTGLPEAYAGLLRALALLDAADEEPLDDAAHPEGAESLTLGAGPAIANPEQVKREAEAKQAAAKRRSATRKPFDRILVHCAPEDQRWCDLFADALENYKTIKGEDSRQAEFYHDEKVLRGIRDVLTDVGPGSSGGVFRTLRRAPNYLARIVVLLSNNYFRRYRFWDPLVWALDQPLRRLVVEKKVLPILVGTSPVDDFYEGLRPGNGWADPRDVLSVIGKVLGGQEEQPGTVRQPTNTRGWREEDIRAKLEQVRAGLDWANTTGSARKWWDAFEKENNHRVALVLRLAEELLFRKATITEFFLAYVYSNTDNIQANLHYMDYTRLKKEEERKKKEAAAKAAEEQAKAAAAARPASNPPPA